MIFGVRSLRQGAGSKPTLGEALCILHTVSALLFIAVCIRGIHGDDDLLQWDEGGAGTHPASVSGKQLEG